MNCPFCNGSMELLVKSSKNYVHFIENIGPLQYRFNIYINKEKIVGSDMRRYTLYECDNCGFLGMFEVRKEHESNPSKRIDV